MTTEVTKPRRIIFLDLDDTLYPKSSGINTCVAQRIAQYLEEELHMENAHERSYQLYLKHGTTLRGLIQEGYRIDPLVSFYAYAHSGFSYEGRLKCNDLELQQLLKRLRQSTVAADVKIYLFTNSDLGHAKRVMRYLGIEELFDGLVTFEHLELNCKPHVSSYEIAMRMAGLELATDEKREEEGEESTNGQTILADDFERAKRWRDLEANANVEVYFFDDNIHNVKAAIELGWTKVVWINEQQLPNIDNVLDCENIYQLEQVCPELLQ